jgi:spore germination cell wall hydrolase CwlJ-like protein
VYDQNDVTSAALCAWKEAREDGSTGMHAVLHCIKNRVGFPGFAHTLHDIIYGKNQFTSMSVPNDPEFNLDPGDPKKVSNEDFILYQASLRLADTVLNTDDADPTSNAHYYENPKTATSGWFSRVIVGDPVNHPMTVKILHHTFYR